MQQPPFNFLGATQHTQLGQAAQMANTVSSHSTPPQPPSVMRSLNLKQATGNLEPLLSMHVAQAVKNKVWVCQYIDLSYLLETNPDPEDNWSFKFSRDVTNSNKLSFKTAKPHIKVDSFNAWNKAFRVLIEIVALKWPDQCLPMV